jgi:c-di-GMP-binding flagellar brake protein YcgR
MPFKKFHKSLNHESIQIVDKNNLITDRRQIIHVLHKVVKDHRQLKARVYGYPEIYNTTILGINPKTDMLAMDGINDHTAHEALLTHKKLHLSDHKDGVELECILNLISARYNSNISYYQMAIPTNLIYAQRRNDYRVTLAGRSQFSGYLELEQQQLITGYALDISLQGLGAVLQITDNIAEGD